MLTCTTGSAAAPLLLSAGAARDGEPVARPERTGSDDAPGLENTGSGAGHKLPATDAGFASG